MNYSLQKYNPTSKIKVSLQINFLLFTLFCAVLIAGYTSINQLKIFQNDALSINSLGIIRGSIQRITKRELNEINSDILIKEIDTLLEQEKNRYQNIHPGLSSVEHKNIFEHISRLVVAWLHLKQEYYILRNSKKNKNIVLEESENCWEQANTIVNIAQKISEAKHDNYKQHIIITLIAVSIFILGIIYLVYKIVHKNLEVSIITDPLTKLFNRNYFDEVLQKQIKIKSRYDSPFSLLLCDVDYFKKINDEFGHQQGDNVLIQLAQLLQNNAREHDFVFRIGGEEFALIFPQTSQNQATIIAEKFRQLISESNFNLNRPLTISIGVSEYSKEESAESLFRRVDSALYHAKSSGRNKVVSEAYQHHMNFA